MFDRRNLNPSHPSGTDQVLDGGDLRERFLTAYILRHGGVGLSQPRITVYSSQDELLYEGEAGAWLNLEDRTSGDSATEPAFLCVADAWSTDDDDR